MAVSAIKAGATDFVLKPWENEKLLDTVRAAVEEIATDQDEHRSARESIEGGQESAVSIIGESAGMTQLLDTAKKIDSTDDNILILGENGTGKDLLARNIHHLSARNAHPYVA